MLIKKNRPSWQEGNFNGVGGAVEQNETPLEAIKREAKEETNLDIKEWNKIEYLSYDEVDLYIYQANISSDLLNSYQSITDEKLAIFGKSELPKNLVEDVKYIVSQRLNFMQ